MRGLGGSSGRQTSREAVVNGSRAVNGEAVRVNEVVEWRWRREGRRGGRVDVGFRATELWLLKSKSSMSDAP